MIEVWLRGPLPNTPILVQPVAHALMQAREEVHEYVKDIDVSKLWVKPAGAASVGFHLQHLTGVLDRLFTYAKGESLSESQFETFNAEGKANDAITLEGLLADFDKTIDEALKVLEKVDVDPLTDKREVGRAKLPTTLLGLYTHAAEHTMRHVGQLLVTTKILRAENAPSAETMTFWYTVDRFDDNELAVLESEEKTLFVPRAFLPVRVKEGDVLKLEQQLSDDETKLHFQLDIAATEGAQESTRSLRANLKRAPSGDLKL